ncbi:MAG: tRNA (cytidine(34)-2'-O)-methyltransferase [Planctomycetota bacterium]
MKPEVNPAEPKTGPLAHPLFHVVLHEPEIPNNTGNIGRTCVATACRLHLIRPLGFDTSDHACRRAGLDYWPRLGVREHDSWDDYLAAENPPRFWFLSTKARRSVFDTDFQRGDALVFGKETRGLPASLTDRYPDRAVVLPMVPAERSLNVATAVCAVVYEGVRQLLAKGVIQSRDDRRLNIDQTTS